MNAISGSRMRIALIGAFTFCVSGCSIVSDKTIPFEASSQHFNHEVPEGNGRPVTVDWAQLFDDPELLRLVKMATQMNFDLKAAQARVDQAHALFLASQAYKVPSVQIAPSVSRDRVSQTVDDPLSRQVLRTWSVPLEASYDLDLWGRLQGQANATRLDAVAIEADASSLRLKIATDVAITYLTLRYLKLDENELHRAIELRQTELDLMRQRRRAGAVGDLDVLRAQTELSTAQADLADSIREAEDTVDALAVLTGVAAPDMRVSLMSGEVTLPAVPAGIPSNVLEQRPDIYAAERRVEAASIEIGVAKTSYLPSLTLTANGGFASSDVATFLDRNSSIWGLAVTAALVLEDGGKRAAYVKSAEAGHDVADANYRGVALTALRQVQDALNDIAAQQARSDAYEKAASTSAQTAELSRRRYEHGFVTYFEVVDADRSALAIQRSLIRSRQAQAVGIVTLIGALGGGWRPGEVLSKRADRDDVGLPDGSPAGSAAAR
jgi:multidrug efflux system outer membrane protein